jgi:pyruvate,water dikinase
MSSLVVDLRDAAAADASRFGPKAANQALLAGAELPIPSGFCLDVAAYRIQLQSIGLSQAAEKAATEEGVSARQFVSEVRIGLFDRPIAPEILEPLLAAWHALVEGTGARTVVRSSALSEDLADSTFAGQYETFLDIKTEADFLTAVRACWAALWSPRALRYMESHNIPLADTAMGLCIQELIAADSSGGGISNATDGTATLTATRGLGTTIAQGEIVPDRYTLDSAGEFLEVEVGRNVHATSCIHHASESVLRSKSEHLLESFSEPCLSPAQAVELGGLMKRAETILGVPAEIEWARDHRGFKMLQARPLASHAASSADENWSQYPGLKGQPSGTGWATGRARVVNCECELSRVAPGDVLVTKVASPSLSQVLPRVAAVVAELGGSTSHLASLARERGIPMVLGVLEATQKIPDGAEIGVDGVIGMVRWQQ